MIVAAHQSEPTQTKVSVFVNESIIKIVSLARMNQNNRTVFIGRSESKCRIVTAVLIES